MGEIWMVGRCWQNSCSKIRQTNDIGFLWELQTKKLPVYRKLETCPYGKFTFNVKISFDGAWHWQLTSRRAELGIGCQSSSQTQQSQSLSQF